MKHSLLKITAFALLIAALAGTACSIPNGFDENMPQKTLIILKRDIQKNRTLRRNEQSTQEVSCEYYDGKFTLSFKYPEGNCTAQIYDVDNKRTYKTTFDSSKPKVVIKAGKMKNCYITIYTEKGYTYTGYYYSTKTVPSIE